MDDLAFLRGEFAAEEGSFLGRLRPDMVWDKVAFTRLERSMRCVCADFEGREDLPRWLVEGFWCCSDWVKAIERLSDLQYWFVMGESLHLPGKVWEEL